MKELLIHLRVLGMFSQHAHNLAKGPLFLQDHCFLGEIYEAANSDYDSVAERIVGTLGAEYLDLHEISKKAFQGLFKLPANELKENKEFFEIILKQEQMTCELVESEVKNEDCSEGTKQLIGEIANQSEVRQYKIQQRLA